jgi:ferritin-like metal-binding protein YciE
MPNLDSLEELLQDELKDIYDAEKQLIKALPKLAKKAHAVQLKDAFEEHLRQTERHVERLEEAFEYLGMPARGKKCEGMKHLIAEGDEMIGEAENEARDAIMIASAQKVEHYEIASYGTLRTWANLLGKPEVAALMEETLEEEKDTDQTLTTIAESFVNESAAEEEDEEEMGEAETATAPRGRGASVGQRRATAAEQAAAASGRSRRRR